MARTARDPKLDTRSARAKLTKRREPYWTAISAGCYLGYRSAAKVGTWQGRMRWEDAQHYKALGAADDFRDADGLTIFSFSQAQERARTFFVAKARELAGHDAPDEGPYTVKTAVEVYLADREQRGSKGVRADRYAAEARILPTLGEIDLSRLTTRRIRDWLHEVANAPKRLRSKSPGAEQKTTMIDTSDSEAVRSRLATANRILTILKAALNHAFAEGKVASDLAWRKVKPYREVDAPVIRYLSNAECLRLVNGCDGAFRDLVRGALVTGCRYGELVRMKVSDFNAEAGKITVALSKAGKRRHVTLADEGRRLFDGLTAGRRPIALIFSRDDGEPWKASHQQRPIEVASKRAGIEPPATFHILRHTYASLLAAKGVPLQVIANQLGHADTRMTEKHYAHLAPSYVADVVRAALPSLGIVPDTNVTAIAAREA